MAATTLSSCHVVVPLSHLDSLRMHAVATQVASSLSENMFNATSLVATAVASPVQTCHQLLTPVVQVRVGSQTPLLSTAFG